MQVLSQGFHQSVNPQQIINIILIILFLASFVVANPHHQG